MQSIEKASIVAGTRVLVRCDLDVPIVKGVIKESYRLDAALPTLKYILKKGGIPIICGHLGKPDGAFDEKLSTKQLIPYFNKNLGNKRYELIENLRFSPGEEANAEGFSQELAKTAQIYVNESFATSHRAHASIVGVAKLLPSYAGLRLAEEVAKITQILENPKKPLVSLVGGIKIESKLPTIKKLLEISDMVCLGGLLGLQWKDQASNIVIPLDYAFEQKDIGPKTIKKFTQLISKAQTIIWVGPMGMYEDKKYTAGTKKIAEAIAKNKKAFSMVGGGDTISAINKLNNVKNFGYSSTGGGAMLTFLATGTLPGLEALK